MREKRDLVACRVSRRFSPQDEVSCFNHLPHPEEARRLSRRVLAGKIFLSHLLSSKTAEMRVYRRQDQTDGDCPKASAPPPRPRVRRTDGSSAARSTGAPDSPQSVQSDQRISGSASMRGYGWAAKDYPRSGDRRCRHGKAIAGPRPMLSRWSTERGIHRFGVATPCRLLIVGILYTRDRGVGPARQGRR